MILFTFPLYQMQKNNPSGLPENADELRAPVKLDAQP